MAFGTKVQFDAVREVAFGSVGASFSAVGTALTDHARLIRFVNSLDNEIYVSYDGVNNNFRMAPNSYILFDFSTNKIRDDGLFVSVGTQFYVKRVSAAPTKGSMWIEVVYASGGV